MLNATLPFLDGPHATVRNWVLSAFLLALAARLVRTRKEGVLVLAAWYAGALGALPFIWRAFFGSHWGWAVWAVLVTVLSVPALLAPRRRPAMGIVVAVALAAIPPIGLMGMGNPVLLAGALFPGAGWLGIVLFLAFLFLSSLNGRGRLARIGVVLQVAAVLWGAAHITMKAPEPPDLAWAATTYFGGGHQTDLNTTYNRIDKTKQMTLQALAAGAKLIVLPEGTDPMWGSGEAIYWQDVTAAARAHHAQVLVGVYTDPMQPERSDGLLDLTTGKLYPAMMTVPFGMWTPWRAGRGFPLRLDASGTVPTPYGAAAYTICYEELLPWPLAWQTVHARPKLLVSAANQWFAHGWLNRPQERSLALQARLWGLPVLRAVNHPPLKF